MEPLDVSINKPFKDLLRINFREWFNEKGLKAENIGKTGNKTTKYRYVNFYGFKSME